jgi:nucleotide-binding universal stress UspA family protein
VRVIGIAPTEADWRDLSALRDRVADAGPEGVDSVAIADPVSVGAGLETHLSDVPAGLLVLGGGHLGASLSSGVARHVLTTSTVPLLIVDRAPH